MFLSDNEAGFKGFLRGVFYLYIAVFPFLFYKGFIFSGTSARAMNLILLMEILAVALGFLLFRKNKMSLMKSPVTAALLLVMVSMFVSSIAGVDFTTSFWSKVTRTTGLYYFLHLGLFYGFITMAFSVEGSLRKFLKVFLISAGIFSIGALLSTSGFNLIFVKQAWAGFTFGNSTFAAMYVYVAFMLSVYYVFTIAQSEKKWWHNFLPIIFILNPYFISSDFLQGRVNILQNPAGLLGGAQASSYALIFSVIALLAVFGISKIKEVKVRRGFLWSLVVIGIVVGTLSIKSFITPEGFFQKAYLNEASSARPMVWQLSTKAVAERPLLGWGVDNFDRAYSTFYDNKVMEVKNGGEAWFDRAHNAIIDQEIETGYVGLTIYILAYLAIIFSMIYVLLKSTKKDHQALSAIIIIYFIGHLLEIQTAFDTTISYVPLTIMAAVAAFVFHQTYKEKVGEKSELVMPEGLKYVFGILLIAIFGGLFFTGTVPIIRAQIANGEARTVGSSAGRMLIYPALFNSPVDTAGFLNRTNVDLQRGISTKPSMLNDKKQFEGFRDEFQVFAGVYEKYVEANPEDYRALIDLADLYIYQRLFDVDNLTKAEDIADRAIALSPNIPQAYWMKSVAYLYQRKFDLAREWAKKAYDLNPGIEESQRLVKYIEESIKTFPSIDLYSFKMI